MDPKGTGPASLTFHPHFKLGCGMLEGPAEKVTHQSPSTPAVTGLHQQGVERKSPRPASSVQPARHWVALRLLKKGKGPTGY